MLFFVPASAFASPGPPLSNPTSASVTTSTATLGGTLSSGGGTIIAEGITWGLTSMTNTAHANVVTSSATSTGVFTVSVTGLPAGTLIYFNAYAKNSNGMSGYSIDGTFTTAAPVSTYVATTTGSGSWTVPTGVTSVQVELWGGGGAGGGYVGGGAAAYVKETSLSVTPGSTITYIIASGGVGANGGSGAGGTGYQNGGTGWTGYGSGGGGGGSSVVSSTGWTYIASGGGGSGYGGPGMPASGSSGGAGGVQGGGGGGSGTAGGNGTSSGNAAAGTGGTPQTGTNGYDSASSAGGGSSAGASGNGLNASVANTGANGSGGASGGIPGSGSGVGGAGGNGSGSDSGGGGGGTAGLGYHTGGIGGQPGGGGGGGDYYTSGGTGGAGELIITYTASGGVSSPTVTTPTSASISTSTATLGGNITSNGGGTITAEGITWGTSANPRGNAVVSTSTSAGVFTVPVTGLPSSTLIYFDAYATNSAGTTYSSDGTFTTNAVVTAPTVTTPTFISVTTSTATLGGNITSNGSGTIIAEGITWGLTSMTNTAHANVVTSSATSTGVFTVPVTGLPSGTQIYFDAYATNSAGTTYSSDGTFTTTATIYGIVDSATTHWAWNDDIGWIDFFIPYITGTVNVSSAQLTGYASSSAGPISLDCGTAPNGSGGTQNICGTSNYKVSNDGSGNLSGWAWNDEVGWISFYWGNTSADPTASKTALCQSYSSYCGVSIDGAGVFHGWAWNDTVGWISFNCANTSCSSSSFDVVTTWTGASQGKTGTLDSQTFDTGVASGAQLNSIMWKGNEPAGTSVGFQIAASNSSSGPWNFIGPDGTSATTYIGISGSPISLGNYSLLNGRYFRYRVILTANTGQTATPQVTGVVVNWSP